MAYFALLCHEKFSLAGNEVLIPAENSSHFHTLCEATEGLTELLDQERERIDTEKQRGYNDGYARGLEAGRVESGNEVAKRLSELAFRQQRQQQKMAESAVSLAIQIVRRIAEHLGPAKFVAEMARSACTEFKRSHGHRAITLFVHPSVEESTRHTLKSPQAENPLLPFVEVQKDEALAPFECLIETEMGTTVASLDYQLQNLENLLQQQLGKATRGEIDE